MKKTTKKAPGTAATGQSTKENSKQSNSTMTAAKEQELSPLAIKLIKGMGTAWKDARRRGQTGKPIAGWENITVEASYQQIKEIAYRAAKELADQGGEPVGSKVFEALVLLQMTLINEYIAGMKSKEKTAE